MFNVTFIHTPNAASANYPIQPAGLQGVTEVDDDNTDNNEEENNE